MANWGLNWRNLWPRTKMQNVCKLKDWFEIWRFGANLHLNETSHFKQNDAISWVFKKKKKETKRCCFEAVLFLLLLLLLPLDMQQGKRSFVFFFSPSPRALLKPKPDATHTFSWWEDREADRDASIGHLYQRRDRVGDRCSPCMGNDGTRQGRPRSPCPYKYSSERKKEGGEKKGGNECERERGKPNRTGGGKEKKKEDNEIGGREEKPREETILLKEKGKPSKKRGRTGSDRGRKKILEKKNSHSCHRVSSPLPRRRIRAISSMMF